MEWTNKDRINEIIDCLESFYSEEDGQKLPKALAQYAGTIKIALSQAKDLKDNLSE